MKLFFKNNKIILISILVLFISVVTVLTKYKIDYNNSLKDYDRIIQYLNDNPGINEITPKKPMMYDTYTLFSYIIVDSPLSVVMFVMPFLVMLSGIYNFYSKLKTGFFKDECMRRSFKKNLFFNFFNSWKNVIIIPIYLLIVFIGCYIVSGNFNIEKTIEFYEYSLINRSYLDELPTFLSIYAVNLILLGIFYINIALIVSKKNNNLFVTLVQSYLIFIIIGVLTEVVIGRGLESLFPILISYNFCNSLSIFNFWVYDNVMNLWFMFGFAFILFLISTIILFINYKNKESVNLEIDR